MVLLLGRGDAISATTSAAASQLSAAEPNRLALRETAATLLYRLQERM